MKALSSLVCVAVLAVAGCAGDKIRVDIPGTFSGTAASTSSGPRVAVLPFEDKRADQRALGHRESFWGGQSDFDLSSGTVSQATANALAQYLTRQGWRASATSPAGAEGADVTIQGSVTDLSLNATGGFLHTDLAAKNSLAFHIVNKADESTVHERVSGTATDQVFWFGQEDAQSLLNDLLESNFRKFVSDVRIDGKAVRLK